jgi:2-phospho-L-lactate guanylyltransferase
VSRARLALAMLGDVLEACAATAYTIVVTDDANARAIASRHGAGAIADPGGGQGKAVAAGLAMLESWPTLVVNSDLPCATAEDLAALLAAMPPGGLALVAAGDGTTNALALATPGLFEPLYGPDSATRFIERAEDLGAKVVAPEIPNLCEDVDTLEDLERVRAKVGPRTRSALASIAVGTRP